MAFNFDEYDAQPGESTGEIGDKSVVQRPIQPAVVPGSAEDIVSQMLRPAVPVGEAKSVEEAMAVADDEYMSEVVERLDVAAHYQLLLRDSFFADPNTRVAKRVTYELRAWVRERLAELVGMSTPKKAALSDSDVEIVKALANFTPAHLHALKLVADKLIIGGLGGPPPPATPSASAVPAKPTPKSPGPALVKRGPAPGSSTPKDYDEAPPKRGPGRPPGSPNKPKVVEPEMVHAVRKHADGSEEPLFNKDGSPRMVKKVAKQVATGAGALPFPVSNQQMTAATRMISDAQANRGIDQHGQRVGGLVELAKTLPEGEY